MKKPVIPRLLLQLILYFAIFVIIVLVQFSGNTGPVQTSVPEDNVFNPRDFAIPQVQNSRDFIAAISRWQDGNFIAWNRLISQQNNEDLVIAFTEESLNRSSYNAALTAIPASFRNGNNRTYDSSVFLGQLTQTYRTLITRDQETTNRLNKLLQEKSPAFLSEPDVFEFLASRGLTNQFNEGIKLVGSMSPEALTLETVSAVFQWDTEWQYLNSAAENPFSHLIEKSMDIISGSLRMNAEKNKVFVVKENSIDTILNIRLGKSLLGWAETRKNDSWIILARSIIISVLTLENYTGSVRAEYNISPEGEITEKTSSAAISTARYYRILNLGEYNPRALALSSEGNFVWAWTAAGNVTASLENKTLDIGVTFPVNETHYIILRGIKPFTKIQLYNVDYRSDPQFERYDSSGWTYMAADQTLLVKMKHKAADEHIKIFY